MLNLATQRLIPKEHVKTITIRVVRIKKPTRTIVDVSKRNEPLRDVLMDDPDLKTTKDIKKLKLKLFPKNPPPYVPPIYIHSVCKN